MIFNQLIIKKLECIRAIQTLYHDTVGLYQS